MSTFATIRMQAVTVTHGPTSELVVHISIECEHCGEHDLLFGGHHVRPIVEVLQELLASDPVGTASGEVQEVRRSSQEIRPYDN
jgi:hypothetical protein